MYWWYIIHIVYFCDHLAKRSLKHLCHKSVYVWVAVSENIAVRHMTMMVHRSFVIVTCCLLVQFLNIPQKRYLFSLGNIFEHPFLLYFQGLMFLVYPLLGHLADVYLTKYCTLKCGLVIIFISLAVISLCAAVSGIFNREKVLANYLLIFGGFVIITGVGLFEANAIQFGLDQLLEALTPLIHPLILTGVKTLEDCYCTTLVMLILLFHKNFIGNWWHT